MLINSFRPEPTMRIGNNIKDKNMSIAFDSDVGQGYVYPEKMVVHLDASHGTTIHDPESKLITHIRNLVDDKYFELVNGRDRQGPTYEHGGVYARGGCLKIEIPSYDVLFNGGDIDTSIFCGFQMGLEEMRNYASVIHYGHNGDFFPIQSVSRVSNINRIGLRNNSASGYRLDYQTPNGGSTDFVNTQSEINTNDKMYIVHSRYVFDSGTNEHTRRFDIYNGDGSAVDTETNSKNSIIYSDIVKVGDQTTNEAGNFNLWIGDYNSNAFFSNTIIYEALMTTESLSDAKVIETRDHLSKKWLKNIV